MFARGASRANALRDGFGKISVFTPLGVFVTGWNDARTMPEQQPCRLFRAGIFTLVCASVSAHGHRSTSGDDIPLGGLLVGMAVVFTIAWAASHRRQGPAMLTAWMLWGQLALHLAYSAGTSSDDGHTVHLVGTSEALPTSPSGPMLATHVMVALVSAWWLGQGEKLLFRFLRFMATAVFTLLVVLGPWPRVPRSTDPVPPESDRVRRGLLRYLRYTHVLRGPPVGLAA